jgi:hypothetical protein
MNSTRRDYRRRQKRRSSSLQQRRQRERRLQTENALSLPEPQEQVKSSTAQGRPDRKNRALQVRSHVARRDEVGLAPRRGREAREAKHERGHGRGSRKVNLQGVPVRKVQEEDGVVQPGANEVCR